VKRIGAIILVVVMVITSTSLQQVFKLPLLVNHYYEHKQIDSRTTVLGFLAHHYFEEEEGSDADDSTDQKLPFKSVTHYIPPTVINATPEVSPIGEIVVHQSGTMQHRPVQKTFISSHILSRIWQPPRPILSA
jgi:hypothetical protein